MQASHSRTHRTFQLAIHAVLFVMTVMALLPFIHILAISLSGATYANANAVGFWPRGFTTEAYREVLEKKTIYAPLLNSCLRVLVGVCVNMLVTIMMAYPLSKSDTAFPGRKYYTWFIIVTMLFSGGLIPNYVLVKDLKILDSVWALVLPGAVPVFHIIVLMNFFRQLPPDIEEAAHIDGASYFTALVRMALPLSLPALATLVLFAAIGHWNAWFDGLIYMRDPQRYPLSTFLQITITRLREITSYQDALLAAEVSQRSTLMAYITISMAPIACVYPFLQKYIRSGLVIGSVKG